MAATYTIPIEITASSKDELSATASAIQIILKHVSSSNLIKLASKIKANPSLVQTALKYI